MQMIALHRLSGEPFVLNAEWIKTIESNPDTRVVLLNGEVYLVRETRDEVTQKAVAYKREVSSSHA
jgi:flagellar protein FlbD